MKRSLCSEMLSPVKYFSHTVWPCHTAPKEVGKKGVLRNHTCNSFGNCLPPVVSGAVKSLPVCALCVVTWPGELPCQGLIPCTGNEHPGGIQGPQVVAAESCLERSLVALTGDRASDSLILGLKGFKSVLMIIL